MAVTKSKAEMVVTWHERGVDIETTCRMLVVTPQEASARPASTPRSGSVGSGRSACARNSSNRPCSRRLYTPLYARIRLQKERKNGSELPELR